MKTRIVAALLLGAILVSACSSTPTTEATRTLGPAPANRLQARITPYLTSVQTGGAWSAVAQIEVSGGQPPYSLQSSWPAYGGSGFSITGSNCRSVQFSAIVKSGDGQQAAITLGFGPTSCAGVVSAQPPPPAAAVLVMSTSTQPAPTQPAPTQPASSALPADAAALDLLNRINALRTQNGLPPYSYNDQLAAAALRHSQDMANTGNISHTGSDGSAARDRILATGYPAEATGEGIYAGASLDDAYQYWSTDPDHRPSLLSLQYTEIGFAQVKGSLTYFTIDFGAR